MDLMNIQCRTRLIISSAILLATLSLAQDVPSGVKYTKASPEVNAKAKASLSQALADPGLPTSFLSDTITCGPILWNDLKTEQAALSKDSTPVDMFLSIPEPLQAQGRGFRTQEQRERFWRLVLAEHPDLRKGVVRIASAREIQYFWSTIPFDIEEPFFAIETPSNLFVANLRMVKGSPVLFWLDRVADLHTLTK